jgi:hypothetical protein
MKLSPPRSTEHHGQAAERVAWVFYVVAAIGSAIGQIWVGVSVLPWPDTFPFLIRVAIVTPFAVVIDFAGVVAAAFADWRQRKGEPARGWRAMSGGAATLAVVINLIGHAHVIYLAVAFGSLGVFAYAIWVGHSAARRRDALRANGKLGPVPLDFGPVQRLREPAATALAVQLGQEHGYDLFTALPAAREQLRVQARRTALSTHVAALLRAQQSDPILADIAVTTMDIDALAAALTEQADIAGWAAAIGANLRPPAPTTTAGPHPAQGPAPTPELIDDPTDVALPADVMRRIPTRLAEYQQWRDWWADLQTEPEISNADFADRHNVSVRQVQWIRAVGPSGLLDSPVPPAQRLAQLARSTANGARPALPAS